MRLASPLTKPLPYPGRVRGGPDWLAFPANWMTEWSAPAITNGADQDRRRHGLHRPPCGSDFSPDPTSSTVRSQNGPSSYALEDQVGTYNLATIMGGGEVVFELNTLIDHAGMEKSLEPVAACTPRAATSSSATKRAVRRPPTASLCRPDASPDISLR